MIAVRTILMAGICTAGCHHSQPPDNTRPQAQPNYTTEKPIAQRPLAYVNGKTIIWANLQTSFLESNGGRILAELVLNNMLQDELASHNLNLTPEQIAFERQILTDALHFDPDQAERMLEELRAKRGLGENRFTQFLWRKAALRLLIDSNVEVDPTAVRQAYEYEYGPRYEARLIVVDHLPLASQIVRRARSGEDDFVQLVLEHSTDQSRAQGGLLEPISPADATYPTIVRQTVANLQVTGISDPIALERGFAILKLERKIGGQPVHFDDVKDRLTLGVRRRVQQMSMSQKERALIRQAKIIIVNRALDESWSQYKENYLE